MANIVQEISVHVVEDSGTSSAGAVGKPTSIGLPGSGGQAPRYCNTNYYVDVRVYDDLGVSVRLHGNANAANIIAGDYHTIIVQAPHSGSWSYTGSTLVRPSGSRDMASATVWTNPATGRGDYNWDFDSGWQSAGKLTDYGGNDENTDGYMYISGTCDYTVTNPIYPAPVRITVPGFLKFLGYFPWERFQDNEYKSCNRSGGHLGLGNGSIWRDIRNNDRDHSADKAHYYKGSKWVRAPKIGAGAQ